MRITGSKLELELAPSATLFEQALLPYAQATVVYACPWCTAKFSEGINHLAIHIDVSHRDDMSPDELATLDEYLENGAST